MSEPVPEIAGISLSHPAQACDNDRCCVFTFSPDGIRPPGSVRSGCPACGSVGFPVQIGLTTLGAGS